jgi:hypothetical protein
VKEEKMKRLILVALTVLALGKIRIAEAACTSVVLAAS